MPEGTAQEGVVVALMATRAEVVVAVELVGAVVGAGHMEVTGGVADEGGDDEVLQLPTKHMSQNQKWLHC